MKEHNQVPKKWWYHHQAIGDSPYMNFSAGCDSELLWIYTLWAKCYIFSWINLWEWWLEVRKWDEQWEVKRGNKHSSKTFIKDKKWEGCVVFKNKPVIFLTVFWVSFVPWRLQSKTCFLNNHPMDFERNFALMSSGLQPHCWEQRQMQGSELMQKIF